MNGTINTNFGAKLAFKKEYEVCDYITVEAGDVFFVANYRHKKYIELYHKQLGELIKIRWEDIDKLLVNYKEEEEHDILKELESTIRDYFVSKGYVVGSGDWNFSVHISTKFEAKQISVLLEAEGRSGIIFDTIAHKTTKEMFEAAFEFFK